MIQSQGSTRLQLASAGLYDVLETVAGAALRCMPNDTYFIYRYG